MRRHCFEKSNDDQIRIDKGLFTLEEAAAIYAMLNSKNPINKVSALMAVLERNGTLIRVLVVVAFLLLVLIVIRIRR